MLNSGYFWELPLAFPPTLSRKSRQPGVKFQMACLFLSAYVVFALVSTSNLLEESKSSTRDFLLQLWCEPETSGLLTRLPTLGGREVSWSCTSGWRRWACVTEDSSLISLKAALFVCWHLFHSCSGAREQKQTQRRVCFVRLFNQHWVTPLALCHLTAYFYAQFRLKMTTNPSFQWICHKGSWWRWCLQAKQADEQMAHLMAAMRVHVKQLYKYQFGINCQSCRAWELHIRHCI